MSTDNLTPDEKMNYTLRLVRDTLYSYGLCTRLFTYLHHAEKLQVACADSENRVEYDALELFIDFMKRAQKRNQNLKDLSYVYTEIKKALK